VLLMESMRICSFLPSATEILFALGLGEEVAGVTFECDYPSAAVGKPIVVKTIMRHGLTQAEIDREVCEFSSRGESLYRVDMEQMESIQPDLIVTQGLCDVCAVSGADLAKALHRLTPRPEVLTLTPHTLEDVLADIERVGQATDRVASAAELVAGLRKRIARVSDSEKGHQPRVACLEWLTPPFNGGHWVPEMVALAGGVDPLGPVGEDSYRMPWQKVLDADPEVVLVMPCGYNLEQAAAEYYRTDLPAGWRELSAVRDCRVYAVNATAYFSRPGPRLVTGLEIMFELLQRPTVSVLEDLPQPGWLRL
jgi:iron complex transport system substrate-binding protein